MKNYTILSVLVLIAMGSSSSADSVSGDYITDRLFIEQALTNKSDKIDISTLQISKDLALISSARLENFKEKISVKNWGETDYSVYEVYFEHKDYAHGIKSKRFLKRHELICLATVISSNGEFFPYIAFEKRNPRAGYVHMSECVTKNGKGLHYKFSIDEDVYFVKPEHLPIAKGELIDAYRLNEETKKADMLLQCVSSITVGTGLPLSTLTVTNLANHYAVDVMLSSVSLTEDVELALDVGELSESSLDWFNENNKFYEGFGGSGSSAISLIFNKEDCTLIGTENNPARLTCYLDLKPSKEHRNIKSVYFSYNGKIISEAVPIGDDKEEKVGYQKSAQFDVNLQFTVHEEDGGGFNLKYFRNSLEYQNAADTGNECQASPELNKPKALAGEKGA